MTLVNLDVFANLLANHVHNRLASLRRAAILVRCTTDGNVVAAIFGNDNYVADPNARREVELLRCRLKEASLEELAFGLSLDGYAWAVLVKADDQGFQTAVGKAFRFEMLRAALDEAVWAAWHAASGAGSRPDDSRIRQDSSRISSFNLL
jgi:hypothetical protein